MSTVLLSRPPEAKPTAQQKQSTAAIPRLDEVTALFAGDEEWLRDQSTVRTFKQHCRVLLKRIDRWIARLTGELCGVACRPGDANHEAYRKRIWGCWRFHWQPRWASHGEYGVTSGTAVAKRLEDADRAENLIRDVVLAEAVTQGDERATQYFLSRYADQMQAIAGKVNARFAEEAWATVLVQVFQAPDQKGRLATYRGERPLASYLATMVIREVYRLANRDRQTVTNLSRPVDRVDNQTPDEAVALAESQRALARLLRFAVQRLSAPDRLILSLRFVHNLTYEQIATLLGDEPKPSKPIHKANVGRRIATATNRFADAVKQVAREQGQESLLAECVETAFEESRGSCVIRSQSQYSRQ